MKYAVDFVINTLEEISGSKPISFQRDGSLYAVSPEGFGQVTYGLHTTLRAIQGEQDKYPWKEIELPPEIKESEDVIIGNKEDPEDEYNEAPIFRKEDRPFIKAISFGPDSDGFTLEEMAGIYHELAELPDDGKIRMVFHNNAYHSHKYGYACDGIDVWVEEARVMGRDRYMELVRQKEDELIGAMKNNMSWGERVFPDCLILTPLLKVTAPRKGKFDNENQAWDEKTKLKQIYGYSGQGGVLSFGDYYELPFDMFVSINYEDLPGCSQENFKSKMADHLEKLNKQLNIVYSNMPGEFIEKMNKSYNSAGK